MLRFLAVASLALNADPIFEIRSSRYPKLTLILEEIDIYFVHRVVSMANPFAKRLADEKKYAVVFVGKTLVDVKKRRVA